MMDPRLCLLILFAPVAAAAEVDPTDELVACAKLVDDAERITCYEELGNRALENETDASQPDAAAIGTAAVAEMPEATEAAPTLPDDIGGAKFEEQANPDTPPNQGRVIRCEEGSDDRWFFYFEGGQVWKQNDTKRRVFRDCDFIATISKDFFGYKMVIEGRDGKIRVNRKR